ncbi:hypothetical protein H6G33_15380 [Calothrix sp. FACHB-1219]|uniref:hypothetical protein n=1 Tax=unclassified Calothrix TaxID=2619626 RepID=UPI000B5E1B84|nr:MULTISPECIES: hypothetical protein [unclassified Calothrix]MBD2207368.1 hypothetical protein [Calothrix sp. FACHB-168]MBD2218417.1 hypothetical protein [Calothrix sp. FACHB-1219]BAY65702.1 hypothetical protein NIES22_58090 [Calothrix brevissima NIES-22]
MSINSTGKAVSPRQKRAKLKGESTVEVENNQGNSLNTDKVEAGKEQPVQQDAQGTLAISGIRPIGSSDLQVAETVSIAGVRPISAGGLQVVETYNVMGIRPIGANTIQVVDSINLSGIRPIASSSLVISESYSVFGNRPMASNEIDDSDGLMGFLD